jgi:trans-2,3-dihydro-3-hydroxyanthranilate isomerase
MSAENSSTKKLNYYILDVFTNQRYKGNPLAVVWCQDDLEPSQYYTIAREFGYSETSFVFYSTAEKAFKVRSFTPGFYEVTGAGHNLLGAVCLALIKGWDIFREQDGEQWVVIKDQRIPLVITMEKGHHFVAMKQQPALALNTIPAGSVAATLGFNVDALALNNWQPTVMKTEVAHLMVPIKSREQLNKAIPDKELLTAISKQYGFEGFYLFTTDALEPGYIAETRFFNPAFGIGEDPATGTAAGPLAGFLSSANYIQPGQSYQFLQGVLVDHPSSIQVRVEADGIWVSGSSVIVMEGVLFI